MEEGDEVLNIDKAININVEDNISSDDMDFFIQSFKSHNEKFIGKQTFKTGHVILKDQTNKIIAGSSFNIIWGWLNIEKFWVDKTLQSKGYEQILLAQIENTAIDEEIKKASIGTNYEFMKELYLAYGFEIDGMLEDRPQGFTYYFFKKETLTKRELNMPKDLQLLMNEAVTEADIKELEKRVNEEQEQILGEHPFKQVKIFARDNENQIIGGLTGYIGWDWLYVSILWVNENYRGHRLGSKLIQRAEEEAFEFGIKKAFLGTTEFQAREFYEKHGYEIFAIQEDLPPGYKNFEMKKYLT